MIFLDCTTLYEAFETAALISKELKRTEFDATFCKKFKLLVELLVFVFTLNVENR